GEYPVVIAALGLVPDVGADGPPRLDLTPQQAEHCPGRAGMPVDLVRLAGQLGPGIAADALEEAVAVLDDARRVGPGEEHLVVAERDLASLGAVKPIRRPALAHSPSPNPYGKGCARTVFGDSCRLSSRRLSKTASIPSGWGVSPRAAAPRRTVRPRGSGGPASRR